MLVVVTFTGIKGQGTYTWQGANGADWTVSTNWNPTRTIIHQNDILQFNDGTTKSITNVAGGSIIGFKVTNNTHITLQSSSAVTISINDKDSNYEFVIENGSSLTLASSVNLRLYGSGAQANISGSLIINSGVSYSTTRLSVKTTVSGSIINYGSLDCSYLSNLEFQAGSEYRHAVNGNPIPTAVWNSLSLCNITGVTTTSLTNSLHQDFGNLTWNCTGQTVNNLADGWLTKVLGTFTIISTGSGSLSPQDNISVGNYLQTGGTLIISYDAGYSYSLNVSGNFSMSGGTLNLSSTSEVGTLNMAGDFSHTGGTISETSTGSGSVVFNGTGTQLYTGGGTISGNINFIVKSGATLQMGTGDSPAFLTGADATFTLSSGATLGITGENGIAPTGQSGNIRVGGTRTYNSDANYIYNRNGTQVTGNGLPTTLSGNLTVSGSSVLTPSAAYTVNGNITIDNGATLKPTQSATITANGQLTVNGTLEPEATSVVSGTGTLSGSGTVKVTRTAATADFLSQYTISNKNLSSLTVDYSNSTGGQTISATTYGNLKLSNTSGTNSAAGNITVTGTLTNSAGTFNIGTSQMTVNALVNNGSVVINSTSTTDNGSLIATSYSGMGTVTYNRKIRAENNDGNFHYIASPVAGNTNDNSSKIETIYSWNEITGKWDILPTLVSLPSGRSYNLRQTGASDGNIVFTGSLVTGNVQVNATSPYGDTFDGSNYSGRAWADGTGHSGVARGLSNYGGGGWNLLGNPYTSAINAAAFVTYNSSMFDPNYVAVYVYDGTIGEKGVYKYIAPSAPGYTFYGSFGSPDIQAGQGFMVLAMNDFSTFTFTPSMKTHNSTVTLTKSSGSEPWPGMVLKAGYGNGNESVTTVVYNDEMTAGLDPGYDVGQLSTWPAVDIYTTLAGSTGSVAFARQALPLKNAEDYVVPVGISATSGGNVTFSADMVPIPGYRFFLEDRQTGIFTDLGVNSYTAFIPANTFGTGRFYLRTSVNTPTAINAPSQDGDVTDLKVWVSQNVVNIEGPLGGKAGAEVYDLMGRKVASVQLMTGSGYTTFALPAGLKGICIIRIKDGVKVFTRKVVL